MSFASKYVYCKIKFSHQIWWIVGSQSLLD